MSLACSVQAGKHTPVEASAAMVRSVDIEASEPRQDRVHLMHISNEGGYPDADDDRGWRAAQDKRNLCFEKVSHRQARKQQKAPNLKAVARSTSSDNNKRGKSRSRKLGDKLELVQTMSRHETKFSVKTLPQQGKEPSSPQKLPLKAGGGLCDVNKDLDADLMNLASRYSPKTKKEQLTQMKVMEGVRAAEERIGQSSVSHRVQN